MNAMRSFENGTLKMEGSQEKGMPPLNSMRVPMENAPAPHLLTQLNPERMYLLGDPRCNLCTCVLVYLCPYLEIQGATVASLSYYFSSHLGRTRILRS